MTRAGQKVVIVTNIVAPYKSILFDALHAKGVDVTVVYLAQTESIREWKLDPGSHPHIVLTASAEAVYQQSANCFRLWLHLRTLNPRVLVVGGYARLEYWVGAVWGKVNGCRLLVLVESQLIDSQRHFLKEWIKRRFLQLCDGVLVDGIRHRSYALSLGMTDAQICVKRGVGPIDAAVWRDAVEREKALVLDRGQSGLAFLYVGRFAAEKALLDLLAAYATVPLHLNCSLTLVGDGPERSALAEYVKAKQLRRVLLPGFQQPERLPYWYARGDIFVLPSIREPWGYVVNEAMAAGLPVLISSQCGCGPDLVEPGRNGFIFPSGDVTKLAKIMNDCAQHRYDLKVMGHLAYQSILSYTPDRVADAVIPFLNGVPCAEPRCR